MSRVISGVEVSDASTDEDDEEFPTENEYSDAATHDFAVAVDTDKFLESQFLDEDENSIASSSQTLLFQNCPLTVSSSLFLIK